MDKPKLRLVDSIPPADEQEIRSVVSTLEQALAEARAGRVLAVAVSMVGAGNYTGYMSSRSPRHGTTLLASVSLTHWRMCNEMWSSSGVLSDEIFPDPPPEAS